MVEGPPCSSLISLKRLRHENFHLCFLKTSYDLISSLVSNSKTGYKYSDILKFEDDLRVYPVDGSEFFSSRLGKYSSPRKNFLTGFLLKKNSQSVGGQVTLEK